MAARVAFSPGEILLIDDSPSTVAGVIAPGWQGHHFEGVESCRRLLSGLGLADSPRPSNGMEVAG